MTFDEFIQTKFFGFLSCCLAFAMLCYFIWKTGYASGYQNGIKDNPKNREVHTYIYEDGRMLRFIPGVDRPVLINLNNNSVIFLDMEPKQNHEAENDR